MWTFSLQAAFTLMLGLAVCLKIPEFYRWIRYPQLRLFPLHFLHSLHFRYILWKERKKLKKGELQAQTEAFLQGSADHKWFTGEYSVHAYQKLLNKLHEAEQDHSSYRHRKHQEFLEVRDKARRAQDVIKRQKDIIDGIEEYLTEDQVQNLKMLKAESTTGLHLGQQPGYTLRGGADQFIKVINQKAYMEVF